MLRLLIAILTTAILTSPVSADHLLTTVTSNFARGGDQGFDPVLWLYVAKPGEMSFDLRADLIGVEQFVRANTDPYGPWENSIRPRFEAGIENITVSVSSWVGLQGSFNSIPQADIWSDGLKHYSVIPTDFTVDANVSIPGPGLAGTPYQLSAISFTLNSLTSYPNPMDNIFPAYDGTYTLRFWSSVAPEPSNFLLLFIGCAAIGVQRVWSRDEQRRE